MSKPKKAPIQPKWGSCVLGCDGGDRDIELAADDLGDVAGCDPFLAYGVHDGTGRGDRG